MMPQVKRKWRPPLALVLFGALASMVGFSAISVFALRWAFKDWGWNMSVFVIGCGLALVTLILAWLLARLILRPVTALSERAGEGTAGIPLSHYGTGELAKMGQEVLAMAWRLETRAEDLQTYAQHVSHELKSPLTTIAAAAELMDDPELPADERARLVARVADATKRMRELLDALHALASAGEVQEAETVDLAPLAHDAATTHGLKIEADAAIRVKLPLKLATAILSHLAQNAAQHGAQTLYLMRSESDVIVEDDGSGVSTGNMDRIFDPFFTTRRDDGGTGMGLAIVRKMMRAQGADISFEPSKNGARLRLSFPN